LLATFCGNLIPDEPGVCIHAAFLLSELRMKSPQSARHFTDLALWFETAMASRNHRADQLRPDLPERPPDTLDGRKGKRRTY
ncbi:hypothetical protein ACC674_37630, partial [Rhizobium ruizarguesonis]